MLQQLLEAMLEKAKIQSKRTGIPSAKLAAVERKVYPFISVGVEFEHEFIIIVLGFYEKYMANFLIHLPTVSNGSIYGTGQFYWSMWQRPHHIKNRLFFKETAQLNSPRLIRQFRDCYVKYAPFHGASCGHL
jgi:hypothetical protein